ncbi:MAG: GNAT family N-acetyltransferase [Candidatus Nealsonbacteria bacterium]
MKIRRARLSDSKAIWLIRNHPEIRKNSFNEKPISFKKHKEWFGDYFKNKNNICFLLEDKKRVLGYCRFDLKNKQREVSIAILPKFQKGGLGSFLLQKCIKRLKNKNNLIAIIKIKNQLSFSFFQKNSFKIKRKNKNKYYLIY